MTVEIFKDGHIDQLSNGKFVLVYYADNKTELRKVFDNLQDAQAYSVIASDVLKPVLTFNLEK